jgi:hypothetical protein
MINEKLTSILQKKIDGFESGKKSEFLGSDFILNPCLSSDADLGFYSMMFSEANFK